MDTTYVKDSDRPKFITCIGCGQYPANCAILRMIYSLKQNLKFAESCPCKECLIKVQCEEQCLERKLHYANAGFTTDPNKDPDQVMGVEYDRAMRLRVWECW